MEKRPNVFPTNTKQQSEQQPEQPFTPALANDNNASADNDYETKKLEMAEQVYNVSMNETGMAAIETMRKRTEEQMKLRDEALKKNESLIQSYQEKVNVTTEKKVNQEPAIPAQKVIQNKEIKSPINTLNVSNLSMNTTNDYIKQLSQPQFNTAFDVIPLPSEGKIYKNKKPNVKVAYMTTSDENILTSPNLLQSGEFLEILINRKVLDNELRYRDLHVGDRNTIMLWLRATSYGEMYPVTIFDEDGQPFETEIDLTTLKTKKLGAEPDEEGYFDFTLPVSKTKIKFKLLNVGDIDDIENMLEQDVKNEVPVNNANTYKLERLIVEADGQRNKSAINEFIQNMRIGDSKALKEYIEEIESGIELEIEVRTPRGGSIKTFLPLNIRFFWPNATV